MLRKIQAHSGLRQPSHRHQIWSMHKAIDRFCFAPLRLHQPYQMHHIGLPHSPEGGLGEEAPGGHRGHDVAIEGVFAL